MREYLEKEKMVREMLNDMGLKNLTWGVPQWLNDICDELIRNGWRKQE